MLKMAYWQWQVSTTILPYRQIGERPESGRFSKVFAEAVESNCPDSRSVPDATPTELKKLPRPARKPRCQHADALLVGLVIGPKMSHEIAFLILDGDEHVD